MSNDIPRAYLAALEELNLSALARATGRAYRTLQSYRMGERPPSKEAVDELITYLKQRAEHLSEAARRLEAESNDRAEEALDSPTESEEVDG